MDITKTIVFGEEITLNQMIDTLKQKGITEILKIVEHKNKEVTVMFSITPE